MRCLPQQTRNPPHWEQQSRPPCSRAAEDPSRSRMRNTSSGHLAGHLAMQRCAACHLSIALGLRACRARVAPPCALSPGCAFRTLHQLTGATCCCLRQANDGDDGRHAAAPAPPRVRAISSTGHTCRGRVKQKSHKAADLVEAGALRCLAGLFQGAWWHFWQLWWAGLLHAPCSFALCRLPAWVGALHSHS